LGFVSSNSWAGVANALHYVNDRGFFSRTFDAAVVGNA
jgi:hypothetical protein